MWSVVPVVLAATSVWWLLFFFEEQSNVAILGQGQSQSRDGPSSKTPDWRLPGIDTSPFELLAMTASFRSETSYALITNAPDLSP